MLLPNDAEPVQSEAFLLVLSKKFPSALSVEFFALWVQYSAEEFPSPWDSSFGLAPLIEKADRQEWHFPHWSGSGSKSGESNVFDPESGKFLSKVREPNRKPPARPGLSSSVGARKNSVGRRKIAQRPNILLSFSPKQ